MQGRAYPGIRYSICVEDSAIQNQEPLTIRAGWFPQLGLPVSLVRQALMPGDTGPSLK